MTNTKSPAELGAARINDADTYGVGDAFEAVYDAQELFAADSEKAFVEKVQTEYIGLSNTGFSDDEEFGAWPISGDDLALMRAGVIA